MKAYTSPSFSVRIVSFICSLFIFLILLFILSFAMYIAAPPVTETTPVRYTLRIDSVNAETAEGIAPDTPVTDAVTKSFLGTVVTVERIPFRVETVENGRAMLYEDTRRVTLLLTVRADAESKTLSVGGIPLLIGKTVYVRLPAYTGASVCIKNTEVLYETKE